MRWSLNPRLREIYDAVQRWKEELMMTRKYDHTEPVSKIRERFALEQLKENLKAANALLKRIENLKEKLEKAIGTLEERRNGK